MQMLQLVGVGKVNTALRLEMPLSADKMAEFLGEYGVHPVGRDSSGVKWSMADVEDAALKIASQHPKKVNGNGHSDDSLSALEQVVHLFARDTGEATSALHEETELIKRQNHAILAAISKIPLGTAQSGFDDSQLSELKDSVTAFMVDHQRHLATQIDSALTGIDKSMEKQGQTIQGQHRAIGEVKSKLEEVLRVTNNVLANVHLTQKATRNELIKHMSRFEIAIDRLCDEFQCVRNALERKPT